MKALHIIAIVLFGISLLFIIMLSLGNTYQSVYDAAGWGLIATVFGIGYSITCLAKKS